MEFYVGDRIKLNMSASPYPEMDGQLGIITDKRMGYSEWHYKVTLDEPIAHSSYWWADLSNDNHTFWSVDRWLLPASEQEEEDSIELGTDLLLML